MVAMMVARALYPGIRLDASNVRCIYLRSGILSMVAMVVARALGLHLRRISSNTSTHCHLQVFYLWLQWWLPGHYILCALDQMFLHMIGQSIYGCHSGCYGATS